MQISFSLVTNLQTCGKWCDRAFAGIRRFSTFLDENISKPYTLETLKVRYLPTSNKRSANKGICHQNVLTTPFVSPSQGVHIKTSQSTMCSLVTTSRSGWVLMLIGRILARWAVPGTRLRIWGKRQKERAECRLFTVLYFSVRSSRSRALRYGLPILHECQNYVTVRRGISKRSHEKIGDREQSKPSGALRFR